ncbi:response regulator transcription factor [Nakamurella lactea]|uniref:response regulator transcription factor n=1 Tax=Nakamurella lactea TaxID=459515 RepID=UPI0009FC0271
MVDVAGCRASECGCRQRDAELIAWVATGLVNDAIGRRMSLSSATIRHYLIRLYARFAVSNKAELVARAIALGLISVRPWPPAPTLCNCPVEVVKRPTCALRVVEPARG